MQRRRQFLATGLGATGAVVLAVVPPLNAAKSVTVAKGKQGGGPSLKKGQADKLTLTEADKAIINYISGFTNRIYIAGGSVAGKMMASAYRCTQLIASISDLDAFQVRLTEKGSPFSNGMAMGNKISFNHLDTTFEVEFLPNDTFQKRVQDMQAGLRAGGDPMIFAHEALLYDPATKELQDPHKAVRGKTAFLKRIRFTESYDELFLASLETVCFNLIASARDQGDLSSMLAKKVTGKVQAESIAKSFLQSLSLASQVSTQVAIAKFFSSNLVRSALQTEFGFDGARVAQNFSRVRSRQSASITDGTVWHAICTGAENPTNSVGRVPAYALGGSSQLKTFLTMQEYQSVALVTADRTFRVYV